MEQAQRHDEGGEVKSAKRSSPRMPLCEGTINGQDGCTDEAQMDENSRRGVLGRVSIRTRNF